MFDNPFSNTTLKRYTQGTVNHKEEHDALHADLTEFYGQNCFWVCYKHPIQKVKQAFHKKEKEGDTNLAHLIQEIKTI